MKLAWGETRYFWNLPEIHWFTSTPNAGAQMWCGHDQEDALEKQRGLIGSLVCFSTRLGLLGLGSSIINRQPPLRHQSIRTVPQECCRPEENEIQAFCAVLVLPAARSGLGSNEFGMSIEPVNQMRRDWLRSQGLVRTWGRVATSSGSLRSAYGWLNYPRMVHAVKGSILRATYVRHSGCGRNETVFGASLKYASAICPHIRCGGCKRLLLRIILSAGPSILTAVGA